MKRPSATTELDSDQTAQVLESLDREGEIPSSTLAHLVPLVYRELRSLAHHRRASWRGPMDPGTTSLVHEAYARLARTPDQRFQGKRQFFAVASKAMRSILVDNARRFQRIKRGQGEIPLSLEHVHLVSQHRSDEMLELDQALTRLENRDSSLVRVVELRCFCGLSVEETSVALELSTATIKRRWALAKALLRKQLEPSVAGSST